MTRGIWTLQDHHHPPMQPDIKALRPAPASLIRSQSRRDFFIRTAKDDPTVASAPYGSRLPYGKPQQSGTDPRYSSTSGSASIASPMLYGSSQRASPLSFQQRAPGSAEYFSLPSPYNDSNSGFGFGRGSVGSSGWSNDVDSQ